MTEGSGNPFNLITAENNHCSGKYSLFYVLQLAIISFNTLESPPGTMESSADEQGVAEFAL